jgi:hypothetical protein
MYKQIKINETILDLFIDLLEKNDNYILYDYKGKENQILLQGELVKLIEDFLIKKFPTEKQTLKELNKAYIRSAFELETNSVVINKNETIFIKIIDETVQEKVAQKDKNSIKNRYNGIKEEELEAFYSEFFEDEENKNFFFKIAQEFVNDYFIVKKISNEEYEKNVFSYIHTITLQELLKIYDDEGDGFFLGFAGYLFRSHFKEVFLYIAEFILDEIAALNPYMMDFLNYYSQNILVFQGVKYKIPHIEAENNLHWTVSSMLSIVKIYTKSKNAIQKLKKDREIFQHKIQKFYVNGISPIKSNELLLREKSGIEIEIEYTIRSIHVLKERLHITKDEKRKNLIKENLFREEEKLRHNKEKKEDLLRKIFKQKGLAQYVALQKELDSLNRKLQHEKKILKQNTTSYNSIKNALVKALISKKSRL